jgi:protein translocase SecG subunit
METFLLVVIFITAVGLIAGILLSPGRSAGLGEVGGGEALFGKKKAKGFQERLDFLVKIAIGVFFIAMLLYNWLV